MAELTRSQVNYFFKQRLIIYRKGIIKKNNIITHCVLNYSKWLRCFKNKLLFVLMILYPGGHLFSNKKNNAFNLQ